MQSILNTFIIIAVKKGYIVKNGEVFLKNKLVRAYRKDKKNPYLFFKVRVGKLTRSIAVHRVVAYQKFGSKIFESGIQVRHLDSNPLNNLEINIAIGTAHENSLDKTKESRMRSAIAASNAIKKHDHDKILKLHSEGKSYSQISDLTGIKSKGTIHFIINKSISSNTILNENLVREVGVEPTV